MKPRRRLPVYRGPLAPTAWSGVRPTDETIAELRRAADRKCPTCNGEGHAGKDPEGKVHPCHCVNRPVNGEPPNS